MSDEIKLAKFDDFKVGDKATIVKTTSDEIVKAFAELTSDFNPLHVNDEFAKTTMFGKRLVHGAFSSGLISAVIGMKIPGPGALYLDQYCKLFLEVIYLKFNVNTKWLFGLNLKLIPFIVSVK